LPQRVILKRGRFLGLDSTSCLHNLSISQTALVTAPGKNPSHAGLIG
jgi:hypothetical protein